MDTADLIPSPEAGRLLGRSPRTVHRLVETGDLRPAMKLPGTNGTFLFHRADVLALADERAKAKDARTVAA